MNTHSLPTGDGSDTLYSHEYQETFHSTFGALTETEYIFLNSTGVKQRLAEGYPTRVLEVGFGTGLNFWVTAQHSQATSTPLEYVALEKHLLPVETLAQLNHDNLPTVSHQIRQSFLSWRQSIPDSLPDFSVLQWQFGNLIKLELIVGEATTASLPPLVYEAIYQDAFSPDNNPELWTQKFFTRLFRVLTPSGKLATYSVKGEVRRRLTAVGFDVQKRPGPPGKREILVAMKSKELL